MKFILFALLFTSCATILNDQTQKVNVTTSTNKKEKVNIQGRTYVVPGIVELKRQKDDVIIQAENDKCTQYLAKSTVDPKFFINILTGGTFGSTTDYSSEKMWQFDEPIQINCM